MHRSPFSHAVDPGLDRVAGDRFLIGSKRGVEREPRVARLLMHSRMPIPDAIGKRGERSKIRFGLGKLGLQRGLQLLEIRTPCIVRGLGLCNNGVPLQLLLALPSIARGLPPSDGCATAHRLMPPNVVARSTAKKTRFI